ncbi:hypothetical protein A7K91_13855 [Paenibacillus oryzae]|uniref:beta-fructofuranosidase n=1 Tax=Paenibacillus oryzae TaxID=1844972 RepID=A0A1A5YJ71_9BACL|nr:glycoside hydrolase family 32 protein [Paenibacillus oryzae]OBR65661.1 hypothetical protein A7K91_13855 [Paenibacillus oryzae]
MDKILEASDYIKKNIGKVDKRPHFHFTPEIGWMNDPNGFSFFKGSYHLFYQHNPYDVVWNNIHWGHATTTDFIRWSYQPTALANDKSYDANGCFSGSAIEKDGKLYLMYTGHIDPNLNGIKAEEQIRQYQCIAVSEDGISFAKHENNPVIAEQELPEGYLICDFRDPKVWQEGDMYYCVLAVRNTNRRGEILMFSSSDLIEWTFASSIYQSKPEDNLLLECPDYFKVDGKDVLLFSTMPCDPQYKGDISHKTSYAIGKLVYGQGRFFVESEGLLDYGSNFYAPQTTEGEFGERLLIGWMQKWTQAAPPEGMLFNGMMSLPRELSVRGNQLIQRPVKHIQSYFAAAITLEEVSLLQDEILPLPEGDMGHIHVEIADEKGQFMIELRKSGNQAVRVLVDRRCGKLELSSDYGDEQPVALELSRLGTVELDIYMDLYSVELFLNNGEKVWTTTSYEKQGRGLSISAASACSIAQIVYAPFLLEQTEQLAGQAE